MTPRINIYRLAAAGAFTAIIMANAVHAAPPTHMPEPPFSPEGRPLQGLTITLDPAVENFPTSNSLFRPGDEAMLVAGLLRHYLQGAGATVHMTRWDDRDSTAPGAQHASCLQKLLRAAADKPDIHLTLWHVPHERSAADVSEPRGHPAHQAGRFSALQTGMRQGLRRVLPGPVHNAFYSGIDPCGFPNTEIGLDCPDTSPTLFVRVAFHDTSASLPLGGHTDAHRIKARALYEGVTEGWASLLAVDGRTTEPATASNSTDIPASVKTVARQLWPHEHPPRTPAEAQWLIQSWKSRILTDSSIFLVDVAVEDRGGSWTLTGYATHPRLRDMPALLLRAAGCPPPASEVRLLPGDSRATGKKFGITRLPMAMTWGSPAEGDNVQTQLLLGDPVFIQDASAAGDYLLIQGADGYGGWVRGDAIQSVDESEFVQWVNARKAMVTDEWVSGTIRIPTGAALPIAGRLDGDILTLRLPPGSGAGTVPVEDTEPLPDWRERGKIVTDSAVQFLTTPYVFGGRSRLGLDCSGLTNVCHAAAGIMQARDARQQVIAGRLVGTAGAHAALMPGDLLFFLDNTGKTFHTGISLGGPRFIHASPPEVQVNSLDPADPLYHEGWAEAFALARRPAP